VWGLVRFSIVQVACLQATPTVCVLILIGAKRMPSLKQSLLQTCNSSVFPSPVIVEQLMRWCRRDWPNWATTM
jgi:hypothetical protein